MAGRDFYINLLVDAETRLDTQFNSQTGHNIHVGKDGHVDVVELERFFHVLILGFASLHTVDGTERNADYVRCIVFCLETGSESYAHTGLVHVGHIGKVDAYFGLESEATNLMLCHGTY